MLANFVNAQQSTLIEAGTIEFEKSSNKFGLIEKRLTQFDSNATREEFTRYKATHPQFLILKSTLLFSKDKSLYVPTPNDESDVENRWNGRNIATQTNTVYNDFSSGQTTTQKRFYGDLFLVRDTIRHITWKITDETREIAGFTCRRANGIFMDSIYVVAFYTNKIPISAGPESFNGLPGMILGVALPQESMTWFATKVNEQNVEIDEKNIPNKGKSTTYRELLPRLSGTVQNSANYRQILKELML